MSNVLGEAKALLEAIQADLPFRVNEVTDPDAENVLATIRKKDGYPAILPHPESQSILAAPRAVFNFIGEGPRVLQGLIDLIEGERSSSKENTRNSG